MIQINFYEQNYFLDEDNEEGILQENFSILHLKEKMIRKIGNQIITHNYSFTPSLLLVDYQGEILSDEIILSKIYNVSSSSSSSFACIHLSIHLKNETIGGKGGFGAQLRSLAKQKVGKQTTNFGACRDLSGRRLRHLNDELILKKWKDAKEKGIPFDPEQETSTGIDLWFLSAPKWADGVKVDRRKRFMKSRMKTSLCIDWLRARERGSPPPTAPNDWGCPRGAFCEFAHGEEELKGFEKEKLENEEHQKYQEEKQKKKDLYMKPLQSIKSDDEISALVLEGLQAAKKAKISKSKSIVTTAISSSSSKSIEENSSSSNATSRNQNYQGPIQLLSGNVVAENILGVPLITGDSKFATITVPNSNSHSVGNWFYEVELLSDGLMQIGWINDQFRSNSEDGMGVGDDQHSWGYDGFRRKLFHNGNEIDVEYYRKSEEKGKEKKEGEGIEESNDNHVWKEEDIVGCLLSIEECKGDVDQKKIVISYYLNGIRLTADFEFFVANDRAIFFPAVSIEDQESIRLNLGVEAFKFPPSVSFTSCL